MLLGKYKNGSYFVSIHSDGTKIRTAPDDEFIPAFAENSDVTISEYCDGDCPYCYAGCSKKGKHCDFGKYERLLNSLHPYTELAINGNDLSHPQLEEFLVRMKNQNIIVNMTVNQLHFERHIGYIQSLVDRELIHGLGISLRDATPEFVNLVKQFPNAVIHVINGLFSASDLQVLRDRNLKLLILGYKNLGRGVKYYNMDRDGIIAKQIWLKQSLEFVLRMFKVVSFDNLALEQLDVRRLLTDEEWEEFYMGDEAKFTFFMNLVQGYFAGNSLTEKHYPIGNLTVDEMFDIIRRY